MHRQHVSGWPRRRSRRTLARSVGAAGLALVLCCVICVALVASYARYEMTHDLPNPYWGIFNRGYSYTPEQGPPSAVLLDTRPDVIALQYLHDYLAVAGTYPCVDQLAGYDVVTADDPVLRGERCMVHRPVTDARVLLVRMSKPDILGFLKVEVHYQINYADGTLLRGVFHAMADIEHSKGYFFTEIHANCWDLPFTFFYRTATVTPPIGLKYFTSDGMSHCAGVN